MFAVSSNSTTDNCMRSSEQYHLTKAKRYKYWHWNTIKCRIKRRDSRIISVVRADIKYLYFISYRSQRTRISDGFEVDMFLNQISYNVPDQRETLYWSLPNIFTGNKIKSYGGKLEFTQRYSASGRYIFDKDVFIIGNGITLYWSNPLELRPDAPNVRFSGI